MHVVDITQTKMTIIATEAANDIAIITSVQSISSFGTTYTSIYV